MEEKKSFDASGTVNKIKEFTAAILKKYIFPKLESDLNTPCKEKGNVQTAKSGETVIDANAKEISGRMTEVLYGLAFALISFLFACAKTAMGAKPLGISLMFASNKYVPYMYFGLVASALISKEFALPLFLTYTAAVLVRIFLCRWLDSPDKKIDTFDEPLTLRIVSGDALLFLFGMYRTFKGGFLYYDILASLFEMAAFSVGTILFSGAFNKQKRHTAYYEISLCGIICVLIFSIREITIFGFSAAAFITFFITLYVSKTGGALRATVFGLIAGIAYNVAYAPAFGIAGIVSGLLWKFGKITAVGASLILSTACGMCTNGFSALKSFAPDLLAASVVFTPLVQLGILPKLMLYSSSEEFPDNACAAAITEKQQNDTMLRLKTMSTAFEELSEVFYNLSDRLRRPGIYEIRQLCDKTFENCCKKCFLYELCYEKEASSTTDVIEKIGRSIAKHGCVNEDLLFGKSTDSIPEFLIQRCPNLDKIVLELKRSYAELLEELLRRDKTEAFAMDYSSMAKLLEYAIDENHTEYEEDGELSKKLREAVKYIDFYPNNIAAFGMRRKCILAGGVDLSKNNIGAMELKKTLENICGVKLTMPQYSINRDYITMSASSARRFKADCAKASFCKQGEDINGDMISVFENREDYYYMLISDGMGSGREAAVTSRICGIFISKMLIGGNTKPVTLEMLNNFIRSKNTECFSTVDLLEIDMLRGSASFVKSGAAASYVLRNDNLYKISSNSMPIGITREINAEEIKFELMEDDIIVMMSDGVAQNFEDSVWLADMLTFGWTKDRGEELQSMAEKILYRAKEMNERSDDMTVGLIRVTAA